MVEYWLRYQLWHCLVRNNHVIIIDVMLKGTRRTFFGGKGFIIRDTEKENSFRWDSNTRPLGFGTNSLPLSKRSIYHHHHSRRRRRHHHHHRHCRRRCRRHHHHYSFISIDFVYILQELREELHNNRHPWTKSWITGTFACRVLSGWCCLAIQYIYIIIFVIFTGL